jgi:hypothetical protein
MNQKPIQSIADLKPPQPGQAQMVPFHLWGEYQRRYGLRVIKQAWDQRRGCPVVYTQAGKEQKPSD